MRGRAGLFANSSLAGEFRRNRATFGGARSPLCNCPTAVSWSLTMAVTKSGVLLIKANGLVVLACALWAQAPAPLKEFSHPKHLKLGNVAPVIAAAIDKGTYLGKNGAEIRPLLNSSNQCEACHRNLENTEKVSRANMPQMADCLVCHN